MEGEKQKAVPWDGLLRKQRSEGGLDLKAPSLQQRLRDELRVLVPARPLAEAGGAQILVGSKLNSLTACSKEVTTGMMGPIGSGLPQFGLPRRFAMIAFLPCISFVWFAA